MQTLDNDVIHTKQNIASWHSMYINAELSFVPHAILKWPI